MKPLKIFLVAIICISIPSLFACKNNSGKTTKTEAKKADESKGQMAAEENWMPEEDSIYAGSGALKSVVFIDEADARALARSYNRTIRPRLSIGARNRGSAVWFDSTVIRLLYEAIYKGPQKGRLDGVRIYYGRYPNNYEDELRAGKMTAFILLTVRNSGSPNHKDTFYFQKPLSGWNKSNADHMRSINHGELCPDSCDINLNLRDEY